MNISEFERTKPVETMKALNVLIKKVEDTLSSNNVVNIFWLEGKVESIHKDLIDIKEKLKRGD